MRYRQYTKRLPSVMHREDPPLRPVYVKAHALLLQCRVVSRCVESNEVGTAAYVDDDGAAVDVA